MFVIDKILSGFDFNAILVVPIVFIFLYLINLLLLRTILTWLSKIKFFAIVIFTVYCLIALVCAGGMTGLMLDDNFDTSTYTMIITFLGVAIMSINYFSYTPLFHRTYYGGGYETYYDHTEHHIFSPDVDYYVEEWHDWQEDGARVAARVSLFVAIGFMIACLILNVWIVIGLYALIRIIRKIAGKDDDDLDWNT